MSKNILKILIVFIVGMVGGIFADQIIWPYFVERPLFYQYQPGQGPANLIKEVYIQENVALEEAIEKAERVIVRVKTETKTGKTLEGSGLILTADGLIVTLAELVPQGSAFNFFVDGERASFQILKRDLENNLALIRLEDIRLSTLGFADLGKLKLGKRVFLVGATGLGFVANEGMIRSFDEDSIQTNILEENTLAGSVLFDIESGILGLNSVDKEGRIGTIPISIIRSFSGL
jgi:S1-C subfamily serine protease